MLPGIKDHYDSVAEKHGLSPNSTMEDQVVRERETEWIIKLVESFARSARPFFSAPEDRLPVVDVGCGNGYTLLRLGAALTQPVELYGFEPNDKMRELAVAQTAGMEHVRIAQGDAGAREIAPDDFFQALICQRVLINILDLEGQRAALRNLVRIVKPGGLLIFFECFQSNMDRLNEARAEFDVEPAAPAYHNLYLPDDFFDLPELESFVSDEFAINENLLSTHYFVSRVLHPALLAAQGKEFSRNSHFVRFFSAALKEGAGEFAPLKLKVFLKRKDAAAA